MAQDLPWLRWTAGLRLLLVDGTAAGSFTTELESAAIQVRTFHRGVDALISFGNQQPHAVLLAPLLPDSSAVEVVAAMRRQGSVPILLGAGTGEVDAAGPVLMAGATALVSRPYNAVEIVTWLARELPAVPTETSLAFGPVRLDPRAHALYVDDEEADRLPLKEFELLRVLMTHADLVVPMEDIKAVVWAEAPEPASNTVAVHVQRLRKRLPAELEVVMVRGLGYRLTRSARGRLGRAGSNEWAGQPPAGEAGRLPMAGPASSTGERAHESAPDPASRLR